MDIPDDDSDILETNSDDVLKVLQSRDVIIKHGLVPELSEGFPDSLSRKLSRYIEESTPWDRVSALFCFDPILSQCSLPKAGKKALYIPAALSGLVGMLAAGMRVVTSYDEFVRSHKLTVWSAASFARRMAADHVFLKSSALFLSVGFRSYILATGCYTLPLILSAINGYSSFWEYAMGWGLTCSIYCLGRGQRQAAVAALLAAVPGLLYGTLHLTAMRKANLTFEDMYREQAEAIIRLRNPNIS